MAGKKAPEGRLTDAEIDAVLDRPISMAALARVLGVTTPAVQNSAIGFQVGWTFRECIQAINNHRREATSGHGGPLADERARLAAAQAERVELEVAVTKKELAPVAVLEKSLTDAVSVAVQVLEAVPGRAKMRDPSFTAAQILILEEEIAKARNEIAETEVKVG